MTAFASQVPILIFAPLGGLWADRFDRRVLLIATQALAAGRGRELPTEWFTQEPLPF